MSYRFFLTQILLILLLSSPGLTIPFRDSQALAARDNNWNLKCSNAPAVVAGSLVDASDVTQPLPKLLPDSGSNQPWFKYLWCVPGTKTYIFLNNGRLEPPPLTYRGASVALSEATFRAQSNLTQHGDGPITSQYNGYMTPGFDWYFTPPTTNLMVYAQSSKGILTWGILVAALTGLGQYVDGGYDFGSNPMVFQINEGQLGEVGIGYVGFIDPNDPDKRCVYEDVQGDVKYCEDVIGSKVIT